MTSQPPPGSGPVWKDLPGSAPASAREGPFSWSSLEPLSRRLLALAGLLSVLLIAVVVDAALQSDGNPLNPIAKAAVRTQAAPGERMAIEAIYTSALLPQPIVAHGVGAYNARTGRSRATLAVPLPSGTQTITTVADRRAVYLRSEEISAGLPPGRTWLGMQPWLGRSQSAALAGNAGTANQLEMMRAVAPDVESVGEEAVRGVATQRYRGSVDLGHYAELLDQEGKAASARQYEALAKQMPAPVEVEVWVDDAGMARRLREVMILPTESGKPPVRTDLRMDLFSFGAAPRVKLPGAHEVFDSTPLVRAELDLFEGQLAQRLIAPAGQPLSPSAYRQRSREICVGIERGISRLRKRATPARAAMERFAQEGGSRSHSPQETLRAFRGISYAYFEPALAMVEHGIGRLGKLSPPVDRAGAFDDFMRQSAIYLEIDLAETRAVEVGQLKLAQSLSDRLHSMSESMEHVTRAAGLAGICAAHDEPESRPSSGSSA